MTAIPLQRDEYYPESDGKPLAETEVHLDEIVYLREALQERFRDVPDVYVGCDMCFYYIPGRRTIFVAPDLFVVFGVPKLRDGEKRRVYKLWEEGRAPQMVIEVTSDSTRDEDLQTKKDLYERLGVQEYFLHDPLGDYLNPRLQGFQLVAGRYKPMDPGKDSSLTSQSTGLLLKPENEGLRLIDAATGKLFLRSAEKDEENARLRAELERRRQG
ncbi:MAG TPA: Uma2 family endonuclease [Thermoanaerobaculia bacterium]|jgi:Uma2 family endonuclease|nr:Uma2 family endonuclease [Thermoanaerobaculia bacterium]